MFTIKDGDLGYKELGLEVDVTANFNKKVDFLVQLLEVLITLKLRMVLKSDKRVQSVSEKKSEKASKSSS